MNEGWVFANYQSVLRNLFPERTACKYTPWEVYNEVGYDMFPILERAGLAYKLQCGSYIVPSTAPQVIDIDWPEQDRCNVVTLRDLTFAHVVVDCFRMFPWDVSSKIFADRAILYGPDKPLYIRLSNENKLIIWSQDQPLEVIITRYYVPRTQTFPCVAIIGYSFFFVDLYFKFRKHGINVDINPPDLNKCQYMRVIRIYDCTIFNSQHELKRVLREKGRVLATIFIHCRQDMIHKDVLRVIAKRVAKNEASKVSYK